MLFVHIITLLKYSPCNYSLCIQISALKSTIRDLQAAMERDKEFNASNRLINVEYLVNILRKFLLSTNPAERAKLVSVLCSILHLRGEDAKEINDKWAVRGGGGLVGWLLPKRTPVGGNRVSEDTDNDGLQGFSDKDLGAGLPPESLPPNSTLVHKKIKRVVEASLPEGF